MKQSNQYKIKILLASHNENKVKEFNSIISKNSITLSSLKNYTSKIPVENGKTFKENALIKAKFASKLVNWSIPTLSDDSGLCIKNLKNRPGIYSARWAKEKNYNYAFEKIREALKRKKMNINGQEASFVCVLAFIDINKKEYLYKGVLTGNLVFPPRGIGGFGYDPIFVPRKYNKTLAELNLSTKNKISHRRIALQSFLSHHLFN